MSDSGVDASSSSSTNASSSGQSSGTTPAVSAPSRLSLFLDRAGLQGFPWVSAIVLYTISWGWLLVVRNSIWWDDNDNLGIGYLERLHFGGWPPWTSIVVSIYENFGPDVVRALIFFAYLFCGVFLYGIINTLVSSFFTSFEKTFLILFFLVAPFNTARVGAFLMPHITSYFLFFFGWYLLIKSNRSSCFAFSLLLFFLSFQIPYMILFFVLPLLSFVYRNSENNLCQKLFRDLLSKRILFLISLPISYLVIRYFFWPDKTGFYQFHLELIPYAIFSFVIAIPVLIFGVKVENLTMKKGFYLLSAGYMACIVGLIPGIVTFQFADNALAKYPVLFLGRSAWHNRQLALQPLGFSIFCIGVVSLLTGFGRGFQKVVSSSLVAIFVFLSFCFGLEHIIDNEKQVAIIDSIKAKQLRGDLNWVFIDDSIYLNARGRGFRTSDWAGFVYRADPKLLNIRTTDFAKLGESGTFSTRCPLFWNKYLANVVSIKGPETHWQALKNWVRHRDMGFKVTVDDTPGACKPEMVTAERVSGAIPILFYFTGAKN